MFFWLKPKEPKIQDCKSLTSKPAQLKKACRNPSRFGIISLAINKNLSPKLVDCSQKPPHFFNCLFCSVNDLRSVLHSEQTRIPSF